MSEIRFKKVINELARIRQFREKVRKFYDGVKECTEEFERLKGKINQ